MVMNCYRNEHAVLLASPTTAVHGDRLREQITFFAAAGVGATFLPFGAYIFRREAE